jgi:hypothetical protein
VAIDACGDKKTCRQILRIDTCTVSNNGARQSTNETITSGPVLVSPVRNQSVKTTNKTLPVVDPKTTSSAGLNTDLQVQAFPNPFSNTVNFRFVSPVSGRAVLEVFNTQGQRVGIVFDGLVGAGISRNVQFSTRLTNQALIYKLKVGDKTVRGTVLELKR